MGNEINGLGLDSTTDTYEPEFAYLSSTPLVESVVYSAPFYAPAGFSKESSPSLENTASSTSYLPRPPHIAIPTSASTTSGAANNRLDTAAIVGIVLGAIASVIATGAIIFYLCHRKRSSGGTRKRESRGSLMDLERKDTSDLESIPAYDYDEVKGPEAGAFALYTKYVPRTLGRLSPVSQTVPPTFDLIKEHHLSSDLSTDPKTPPPRSEGRKGSSPGYLNDIALTVTPFDTRFHS